MYNKLALSILAAFILGCTGPRTAQPPIPILNDEKVQFRSADLDIRLVGALGAGNEGTLVLDAGWVEYLLEIENRGKRPLTIYNVKLLTRDGRYLDSAADYEEITAPPDAASELAEDIAKRSAGIAAGQVIPYGGAIVGILSGAVSASAAQTGANAQREFVLRRLKEVELAPGGRVQGSAFLPAIQSPKSLVLDCGCGGKTERIELSLAVGP